jgi:hypothetical protein
MEDGDHTGSSFDFPGRKAEYLTIADLLVTAPLQSPLSPAYSVTVAVEPGVGDHWYVVHSGWEEYVSGGFELSDDLSELTVTAVDEAGDAFTATVDTSDTSLIKWLGEDNGVYLMRMDAGPDDIGLEAVDDAEGEAEGEAPLTTSSTIAASSPTTETPSVAADAIVDNSLADDSLAGEGEAAPSFTSISTADLQFGQGTSADQSAAAPVADADIDASATPAETVTTRNTGSVALGASTPVSTIPSSDALSAVDAVVEAEAFAPEAEPSAVDDIAQDTEDEERDIVIDSIFSEDSLFVSA